jgi:hypothetical protein
MLPAENRLHLKRVKETDVHTRIGFLIKTLSRSREKKKLKRIFLQAKKGAEGANFYTSKLPPP